MVTATFAESARSMPEMLLRVDAPTTVELETYTSPHAALATLSVGLTKGSADERPPTGPNR